jgi:hypothetical protein
VAKDGISEGKINMLGSLETLGVSLVKRGANKRMFALTKSVEGNEMKLQEMLKTVIDEGTVENPKKLEAIAKSAGLSEKGAAALEAIMKFKDAFADEPGLKKAFALVAKADGTPEEDNSTSNKSDDDEDKDKADKAKKARKTRKANGDVDADDMKKEEYEEEAEEEEEEEEESRKAKKALAKSLEGLPAGVKGSLEAVMKSYEDRLEAAQEQTKELQRIAKSETNIRLEREWITKAEKHLTHVPNAKPVDLAKKLHKLAKHDAEAAQEQFDLLKRSSDAIKKSAMFRDVGTGNTGDGSMTAYDEIQSKVESMILKSEGKLTREQATVKIMQSFPDLYAKADEEHQERIHNRGR